MKIVGQIVVYSLWFAFVLWLSFWFSGVLDWMVDKFLPKNINDRFELFVFLPLWLGFICMLGWLPIWWMRKRHSAIVDKTGRNITFFTLLLGCIFVCTIAWDDWFPGKLYNCTDSVPFDFLQPGNWVHGNYVTVAKINPNDSMSMPDSIKQGWSVPELWLLWWSFIAASVAISASLATLIFLAKNQWLDSCSTSKSKI
jgi:hypothetical protein